MVWNLRMLNGVEGEEDAPRRGATIKLIERDLEVAMEDVHGQPPELLEGILELRGHGFVGSNAPCSINGVLTGEVDLAAPLDIDHAIARAHSTQVLENHVIPERGHRVVIQR